MKNASLDPRLVGYKLHATARHDRSFDFVNEGQLVKLLLEGSIEIPGYYSCEKVPALEEVATQDQYQLLFHHNDFFYLNFLIGEAGTYSLII